MRVRLVRAINYFIGLSAVYLILCIILPINTSNQHLYNLTNSSYHILQGVLAVPLIAIWFAAFFGYAKLKQYADSLKGSEESKSYNLLARGCMWLAWGLPVLSIASLLLNSLSYTHPHHYQAASIILSNYINILIPLIAFSILSSGSRKLLEQFKQHLTSNGTKLIVLLFVAIAVGYCYLIFRPINLVSMTLSTSPYYLPIWLVIITVTIPSLYTWLIGILSAGEIARYGQKASGLLYRQAFQSISLGIIAVIAGSIAYQYVTTIDPTLNQTSLDYLLFSTYIIRIMSAFGFIAIANGAIKLKRIEEV
jgi:hypothetical protein